MTNAAPLPARNLGAFALLSTLVSSQLRHLARQRKTRALALVEFLPVLGALAYVLLEDIDGLTMFTGVVDGLAFPFLVPLAAIFFGGPAIVDEMEGRTLTYLTLRPIPKPMIFLGKWIAGTIVAELLVLVPMTLLLGVCLGTTADFADSLPQYLQILAALGTGVAAYTAIFATLGAIFASSLLASILYFVGFEMVLAALPVLELLSLRYHLRTAAGLQASDRLGLLDRIVLDSPITFDWWIGGITALIFTLAALLAGAQTFKERTYHV